MRVMRDSEPETGTDRDPSALPTAVGTRNAEREAAVPALSGDSAAHFGDLVERDRLIAAIEQVTFNARTTPDPDPRPDRQAQLPSPSALLGLSAVPLWRHGALPPSRPDV